MEISETPVQTVSNKMSWKWARRRRTTKLRRWARLRPLELRWRKWKSITRVSDCRLTKVCLSADASLLAAAIADALVASIVDLIDRPDRLICHYSLATMKTPLYWLANANTVLRLYA